MGIDSTRVKKALKQRMQETGSGFKSTNELVEAILLHGQTNATHTSYEENQGASLLTVVPPIPSSCPCTSSSAGPSQPQVPHQESQSQSNRVNPSILTTETMSMLPCGNESAPQRSSNLNVPSDPNSRTCASAPGTLETSNPMESGGMDLSQLSPLQPGTKDKNLAESSIDLEVENRRLKDQRTCKICMDREIGVVFLTCGHLISCVQCAPALKDCPLCRQTIVGTVKTYMS